MAAERRAVQAEGMNHAGSHADGRLTDDEYLEQRRRLDRDAERAPVPETIDAAEVVRWVRDLPRLWEMADPEQRREMVGLIYDRIVIEGGRFVEVVPTPYAVARGLPALLPDRIHGGAGEPGRTRARRLNHALIVVPVRGRRELLRAMRRRA